MPVFPCNWPICAAYVGRRGAYCDAHRQHGREDRREIHATYDRLNRDQEAAQFYASAAWQRARRQKLAINPVCERCERRFATTVHHRTPLDRCTPEQRLAQSNLMSLCGPACHNAEEAEAAR